MTPPEEEIIDKDLLDSDKKDNSDVNDETPDKKDNSLGNDKDKETFEKRYSDSSREAKKIAQTHSAYRKVLKDNSHLLELEEGIAKDVVKQLFEDWYSKTDSLEELIELLKWWSDNNTDSKAETIDTKELAKKIRAEILEEQQEEEAQKILETSLKKFDEETKKLFLEEFKDTVGKRKLTPKLAEREIKKIIIYHNSKDNKGSKKDEALSNLASTKLWSSKTSSTTTMTKAKLEQMWVPENRQKILYPELFPKK